MYNSAFEDDLCKDRNQSFRKALRIPRGNQRNLTNFTNESTDDDQRKDERVEPGVDYINEKVYGPKYNWKCFLPWARKSKGYPSKHPIDDCGFISLALMSWASPIMKKGFKKPLEISDLGKISQCDSAAINYKRFNRFWIEEVEKKGLQDASVAKALIRAVRTRLIVGALLFQISLLASFIGPNSNFAPFLLDLGIWRKSKSWRVFVISGIVVSMLLFPVNQVSVTARIPNRLEKTKSHMDAEFVFMEWAFHMITRAFLINRLLKYVEGNDDSLGKGLALVVGLFVSEIARSWLQSLSFLSNIRTGTRARAMIWTMVYTKMSHLKNAGDKSIGELVNICANDAQRVFEACLFGPFILGGPVALIIVITYTTYILGPSALLGCFIFLIMFPIQGVVGKLSGKFRGKAIPLTDQRVKLMSEVLNCIKLIKMYAWEKSFAKVIGEIRVKERTVIGHSSILQSLNISMSSVVSTFATVTTFVVHVYSGNDLVASQAFTVIAVFNAMIFVFAILPFGVRAISEAKVSMTRLKSLMIMEEFEPWHKKPDDENVMVEIQEANFAWNEVKMKKQKKPNNGNEGKPKGDMGRRRSSGAPRGRPGGADAPEEFITRIVPTLFELNLTIQKGNLIGICGGVGSGKSSLINAILGQMDLSAGSVSVAGSIAYVAQQAWLMNATVKENIVFGKTFKPNRYEKVIASCSLEQDLTIFLRGDHTEVGERGINLSGGQKQRISLARAVYADKDIYLLDDPLSAVDSHVGQHIFESCIKGTLSGKTIIFVTHQLQYLNRCDSVILMKEGRISEMGPYDELMNDGKEFSTLIQSYHKKLEAEDEEELTTDDMEDSCEKLLEVIVRKRTISRLCEVEEIKKEADEPKSGIMKANGNENGKDNLMREEDRQKGSVSYSTYAKYIKAAGGFCVSGGVILMIVVITFLRIFPDFWLGRWINEGNGNQTGTDSSGELNDNPRLHFYSTVYATSLLVLITLLIMKCFIYVNAVLRASSNLHNQVFRAVTKSPMRFFDTTPVGQILNRFSKDMDEIDTRLPFLIEALLLNISFIFISMILIAVMFYWFLIALVFFLTFFVFLTAIFRRSVRELKRLDNVSRSPIFSHIATSIQGLSTLHAYGKTGEFVEKFEMLLDNNTAPFFMFACSNRWLAVRLDVISIGITTITAFLIVMLRDSVPAAMGGLAITYAIRMSGLLQFTVRMLTEVEAMFTGVERLVYYTENLEQEAPSEISEKKPMEQWPERGQLSIFGLKMRYRENLPLVLKGITCNIKPREKIGIVGRTGSGKSSLGVCLFRLVEPTDGTITIDGINILKIGLDDLRSKLSIIPQDPVLFIGTVRYNLDPFDQYSDDELWTALERAHLKDTIIDLPLKLLAPVVGNGENFSVGERQLMCMARALLRNSKILMLDEATAAIDSETDTRIQDTIRQEFKECTMLTIAHRLHTVMDSDRIMVMEEGQIVEFDKPFLLLANPNSLFSSLVAATEKSHAKKGHSTAESGITALNCLRV